MQKIDEEESTKEDNLLDYVSWYLDIDNNSILEKSGDELLSNKQRKELYLHIINNILDIKDAIITDIRKVETVTESSLVKTRTGGLYRDE